MNSRNQYLSEEEWNQLWNTADTLVCKAGNFELRSGCDIKERTAENRPVIRKNRWAVWDFSSGAVYVCANEEVAHRIFKAWTT